MPRSTPLVCLIALAATVFCPRNASAQTPAASQNPSVPTLHARTKLVVIDVVITDKDHRPVHSLRQDDFTLLESGEPQTVKSFEEHRPNPSAAIVSPPSMPPGFFTNLTPVSNDAPVNILVIDTLNTALTDQTFVRDQMLKYLKSSHPNSNMAVFGLSTRLLMLQGFTTNPELLRAVINRQNGNPSPLMADAVGAGLTSDELSAQLADAGAPASLIANLESFESDTNSFNLQQRAIYTLKAMSVLGRYLADIPGRKNLIWFSGSFPLNILPAGGNGAGSVPSSDPFSGIYQSDNEYRETANLLARSRVAVYPVDARGIITQSFNSASNHGRNYASNPGAITEDISSQTSSLVDEHSTMTNMAEDTGGRVFLNTNDLSGAISRATEEGSSFYTITYTPSNTKWIGEYRKIEVKLAQKGYTLAYRKGYYADDSDSTSASVAARTPSLILATKSTSQPLPEAMVHGLPGATQIIYKLRVLPVSSTDEDKPAPTNLIDLPGFAPAKGPFRRYSLDFAAPGRQFTFTTTPDGIHHTSLEFVSILFQPDGKRVNLTSTVIKADLNEDRYNAFIRSAIPVHQEISVPAKGEFSIRTGVYDRTSSKIGVIEVPVAAVKTLPPAGEPASPAKPGRAPTN